MRDYIVQSRDLSIPVCSQCVSVCVCMCVSVCVFNVQGIDTYVCITAILGVLSEANRDRVFVAERKEVEKFPH